MRRFLHFLFVLGLIFAGLLISHYTVVGSVAFAFLVLGSYSTRLFYKLKG